MSAVVFAKYARKAPIHRATDQHNLVCHAAVMYWAFRVLTHNKNRAADRVESIAAALCEACHPHSGSSLVLHGSIHHDWYGANMCKGYLAVRDLTDLRAYAEVGDVLIVGDPRAPVHSMVVVRTDGHGGRISIRGFNNWGTFHAGPPNQYDPTSRDITAANLWQPFAGETLFGVMGNGKMYRIQFGTYVHSNAQALMRKFSRNAARVMQFEL